MSEAKKEAIITTYLPLIIAIITVSVGWGVLTTRLAANEVATADLKKQFSEFNTAIVQQSVDIGQIKTSLGFIEKYYKK